MLSGGVRVEIIQELDPGDPTLEIPWASEENADLRYVDLKQFPEKILSLKECRRHPPLAALLREVNAPNSFFRTAKCDIWVTTRLAEDELIDFPVRFKVGSYVDLVFDAHRLHAHLQPYLQLGLLLEQLLRPCRVQAQVDLSLRKCLFRSEDKWGYYVTIFVHAYGASGSAAKEQWRKAVACLAEALKKAEAHFLVQVKSSQVRPRRCR